MKAVIIINVNSYLCNCQRLEEEHQAHAELRVMYQKVSQELADTKTQVKTEHYKVDNYDRVKWSVLAYRGETRTVYLRISLFVFAFIYIGLLIHSGPFTRQLVTSYSVCRHSTSLVCVVQLQMCS